MYSEYLERKRERMIRFPGYTTATVPGYPKVKNPCGGYPKVKIAYESNPCGEYPMPTEYEASWGINISSMTQALIDKMINQTTAWDLIDRKIVKVIFNDPATIILWDDGEKTVVMTQDGEPFDEEKGFLMAVAKYLNKGKGSYFNLIKKHCY